MEYSSSLDERANDRARVHETRIHESRSYQVITPRALWLITGWKSYLATVVKALPREPVNISAVPLLRRGNFTYHRWFAFFFFRYVDESFGFLCFSLRITLVSRKAVYENIRILSFKRKTFLSLLTSSLLVCWRLFLKAARLGSQNFHLEQDSGSRIRSDSASSQQTKKSS